MLETCKVDRLPSLLIANIYVKHAYYRWVTSQSITDVYLGWRPIVLLLFKITEHICTNNDSGILPSGYFCKT